MSKDVKINNTTYRGVSSVSIPLEDNSGNALFRENSEVINTPTATKTITANGTHDVTNYASAVVAVSEEAPTLQAKTVTPSTSAQTVEPDSGYTGLSSVTVAAIQTQAKSVTPSTSAQTVTADSGKYLSQVTVAATSGSPTLTALSVSPTTMTVANGSTSDAVKSGLTAMSGTYTLSGYTGTLSADLTDYISSATVSGTMPTAGNTATMTVSYGGKSAVVSVTMEAAVGADITVTYNGDKSAIPVGTVLTLNDFTVTHYDTVGNVMTSGWKEDYLYSDDAGTIASYTVVEGSQTIKIRTRWDSGVVRGAMITLTGVGDTVSVTGVTLNTNSGTMAPGDTFQLTATVSPSNATNKSVTWSSSAPAVAKVENGLVTALTAGSADITVTTVDGGFTATYSVTVAVLYSAGTGTTGLTYGSSTLKVTQDTGLTAEPLKILAVITDTATQVGVNTGYYYIFERSGDTWSCSKLGRAGDSENYADGAYQVPPAVDWTSSYPTVVTVNYETTTDGTYKVSSIVMSSWSGTPEMKFTTTAFTVTVSV